MSTFNAFSAFNSILLSLANRTISDNRFWLNIFFFWKGLANSKLSLKCCSEISHFSEWFSGFRATLSPFFGDPFFISSSLTIIPVSFFPFFIRSYFCLLFPFIQFVICHINFLTFSFSHLVSLLGCKFTVFSNPLNKKI